jgi:DNA-binding IclR family transcriptional regulator
METDRDSLELAHAGPLVRGSVLLRLLATAGPRGAALTQLAAETGLANSSVHRLLKQLAGQRLAMQIEGSARYAIGPLAYELGLAAEQQFDIREICRPAMERLAQDTAETAYLAQRSGDEEVCIELVEGPGTVRIAKLRIGSRRPLGLGSSGLAIVGSLPREQADATLARVQTAIVQAWRVDRQVLADSLEAARRTGFGIIQNRVTPGVTGIGRSFRDSLGHVFGAVSVAGANERMTPQRLRLFRSALDAAAQDIEGKLRGHQWARYP